jgi:hypothetical protein
MHKWVAYDHTIFTGEILDIYRMPWIRDAAGRRAFRRIPRVPISQLTEPADNPRQITLDFIHF